MNGRADRITTESPSGELDGKSKDMSADTDPSQGHRPRRGHWKYAAFGLSLASVVIGFLTFRSESPPRLLPVPNGYDDLLKAAKQAVSHRHLTPGQTPDAELRELVKENQSALSLARTGLKRETKVATDYSLSHAVYAAQHMPILADFKRLALAFRAEGELAEREGRTNDAVQAYLTGMSFGQELCRGGLMIDRLVGISCERICFDPLQALAPDLDGATTRPLLRRLEQTEASREPIQATFEEERHWATAVGSWRDRLILLWRPKSIEQAKAQAAARLSDLQSRQRRLMLKLAERTYELEHGKSPERSSDLVPDYLQSIPKDPATGGEMRFPYGRHPEPTSPR